MDTRLEDIKGIDFTTVASTAFSSLHGENQLAVAERLAVLKQNFMHWLEVGEVKELPLFPKQKTYTFDYRYLKIIFGFDSHNEIQVIDIINKTWWQEHTVNQVA